MHISLSLQKRSTVPFNLVDCKNADPNYLSNGIKNKFCITCLGLKYCCCCFSDTDGPRVSCRFPEVLVNRNRWRDLSGKWLLEVESGLQVLRLKDRVSSAGLTYDSKTIGLDTSATKLVINCVQKTDQAQTASGSIIQTDYLTFVTDDNWYVYFPKTIIIIILFINKFRC